MYSRSWSILLESGMGGLGVGVVVVPLRVDDVVVRCGGRFGGGFDMWGVFCVV
jgi:hypothetical protein